VVTSGGIVCFTIRSQPYDDDDGGGAVWQVEGHDSDCAASARDSFMANCAARRTTNRLPSLISELTEMKSVLTSEAQETISASPTTARLDSLCSNSSAGLSPLGRCFPPHNGTDAVRSQRGRNHSRSAAARTVGRSSPDAEISGQRPPFRFAVVACLRFGRAQGRTGVCLSPDGRTNKTVIADGSLQRQAERRF
jgi:hypothetical protein